MVGTIFNDFWPQVKRGQERSFLGCDLVHSIHSLSVSSNLQILLHYLHHQNQISQPIKIKPIKGQEKLIEWKLKKLKIEKKRKRGCYKCVFSANKILKSESPCLKFDIKMASLSSFAEKRFGKQVWHGIIYDYSNTNIQALD